MQRIGIDLGGTKTEVAVVDPSGQTRFSERAPTPIAYSDKIRLIAGLVEKAGRSCGSDSLPVGVGHPGSLNPRTGLMRNANSTELNGHALNTDIEHAIGRPVRCANDANCFALSEARDGAGRDAGSVFGVIIGTGVGGGIVINGELWEGGSRLGGEWGHTALPWPAPDEVPGPACKCGLRGCLESWISGPAISADHRRATGADLAAEAIVADAEAGDQAARGTIDRFETRLARGLATVINIVDPEIIVLGGGLSNIPELAERVETRLAGHVFSDAMTTRVRPNVHGDSSGVRGAAWLWPLE
ncbi:ROK family protein [Hyphobacterium sp.]|uniref:ROK family protein n=1 Tax=Hyphobacterium sp. TaxID=2004662 RepID=UPI003B52D4E0